MPFHLKRLKKIRIQRGFTEEEVAAQLGISVMRYEKYERGEYEVRANLLIALVKILDTSADYLTELSDDPQPYHKR